MSLHRPIPIYPWPQPDDRLAAIYEAFMKTGPNYSAQPVPAQPGEPGRVLGMGEFPPFVCELAYVPDPTDQGQIDNRVKWMLTDPDSAKGFGIADYLSAILGAPVKEVEDAGSDTVHSGPRFQ